jgi:ligand-binding SRPBCC domain-containing protein
MATIFSVSPRGAASARLNFMTPSHSLFERSVLLSAPAPEVYAFHEDPRNIVKISPSSLRVEKVECSVPARVGGEFRLRVSQFGLPMEWIGYWDKAEPFCRLVDGARKSPFRHWRHHHLFSEASGGTLMTDRVEYALPFGLLGRFLDRTVMRVVFAVMFAARHRATRNYFARLNR